MVSHEAYLSHHTYFSSYLPSPQKKEMASVVLPALYIFMPGPARLVRTDHAGLPPLYILICIHLCVFYFVLLYFYLCMHFLKFLLFVTEILVCICFILLYFFCENNSELIGSTVPPHKHLFNRDHRY